MSDATVKSDYIEITPGVCAGKPCIRGRRIRVQDVVVWHENLGLAPDEIVARYPQLTLAEVHAALSYYFDHVAEIRAAIQEDQAFADELKASTPSKLVRKLAGGDADAVFFEDNPFDDVGALGRPKMILRRGTIVKPIRD